MKRLAVIVLSALAVVALCIVSPRPASGQTTGTPTATPSPTPTATPPPIPSGADLINEMLQAITAKNSYRAVLTEKLTVPQLLSLKIHAVIDQSLKPLRGRATLTETGSAKTSSGTTKKLNIHAVLKIVGKREALRQGKKKWSCSTITAAQASGTAGLPTSSMPFQNPMNLGAVTIGGVPAWHVTVTIPVNVGGTTPSTGTGPMSLPVDLYISQSDFSLLRETTSVDETEQGITIHVTLRVDISKYGETVKVKLPAACKR